MEAGYITGREAGGGGGGGDSLVCGQSFNIERVDDSPVPFARPPSIPKVKLANSMLVLEIIPTRPCTLYSGSLGDVWEGV